MTRLCDKPEWVVPIIGREHHVDWLAGVNHPDAKLIEAAPELLEALEETLQQYVSLAESGDAGNWDPHKEAFVIKAKAAIAKAKGEA